MIIYRAQSMNGEMHERCTMTAIAEMGALKLPALGKVGHTRNEAITK